MRKASLTDEYLALRETLAKYSAEMIKRYFPEVYEEASYAIQGGKLIRGSLSLLIARILSSDIEKVLPIAFSIELMHAASLIHDDIADESESRRGRQSFWKKYGLKDAVTFPHIIIPVAITLVAEAGVEAVIESMLQWRKAALGQLWDTRILEGKQVQVAYEQLIEYKTASVFEASCSLPLIALGKRDLISAGKTYGKSLGMLYQVLDDYADIANNNVDSGSSRLLLMQLKEREGIKRYVKELVSKYFTEIRDASIKLHPSLMDFAVMSMEKFASEAGESVQHILQEVEEKIL
ncbi:MAG: polyprenyl synthetase family protein [Thermofilum sp.]|jgi:geranylgeranyl pyrophosphate synthase|uniref:polyprenyl synthetase family protein n=1 Tax=Thermofilum sp. TaxID=1961369 RepID=UPI002583338A|nr:polyprenyl synthetase family protein [Thermofilum sp.]MCI4408028.1 polyprenyl synthetase family protein [Thermofilum sp.]